MVAAKTERLLNLVICLLYTRRPLTKEQIRASVAQYAGTSSDEAFDRMFERDKDELRELGIPLVASPLDRFFEDEIGYRIDRREYALPQIEFTREELTVLGLAAKAWEQASLAGPAAAAMRKLAATGVQRDDASIIGLEPRVTGGGTSPAMTLTGRLRGCSGSAGCAAPSAATVRQAPIRSRPGSTRSR